MSFLYRAKLYRSFSMMACVGLVVAYQSIAAGAIPAVVALQQDDDHKKEQNVKVHKIQSDDDDNVEVIVIQDGDSGHQELLNQRKTEHKIDINKLHAGQGGNIEVVVVKGDEDDENVKKKLHGHLVELMHGKGTKQADLHELANQLRAIADQLDGKSHAAHEEHVLHPDMEVHRSGDHGIHILKKAEVNKSNNEEVEVVVGDGKRYKIRKSNGPQELIFEVSPDGKPKAHSHDGDPKKIMLHRTKDHDPSHNVIVEKIHVDEEEHSGETDLHFGTTSDGSKKSTLEELRNELKQLREDLRQLKANRPDSSGKRVRLKKQEASSKDKGSHQLFWVEEDKLDKSDNKVLKRELEEQAGKANPNRFRIEFKKKDKNPEDTNDDNDD